MNDKQNALEIIRFGRPERVVGGPPTADCSYFGCDHEPYSGPGDHNGPIGIQWHDIWGVGWDKQLPDVMGFAVEHPLADLSQLRTHPFPDPDDPRLCRRIFDRAATANRQENFLIGRHRETLWERAYNLVGMDRLMLAFYDAPEAVRELLHRIMNFQLGMAKHYLAVGIEVAGLGDDLGSQHGLLFGRGILNDFFVSEYRRLTSLYRQHGVLIQFHSCGHIEPIVDVLMDLGVDILNPVQATANNLDNIRQASQGRMALQGGVSSHRIMLGPAEAIAAETRQRLWQLGRHGGYFCSPDQGMPFPKPHRQAFEEALERFGRYPILSPGE